MKTYTVKSELLAESAKELTSFSFQSDIFDSYTKGDRTAFLYGIICAYFNSNPSAFDFLPESKYYNNSKILAETGTEYADFLVYCDDKFLGRINIFILKEHECEINGQMRKVIFMPNLFGYLELPIFWQGFFSKNSIVDGKQIIGGYSNLIFQTDVFWIIDYDLYEVKYSKEPFIIKKIIENKGIKYIFTSINEILIVRDKYIGELKEGATGIFDGKMLYLGDFADKYIALQEEEDDLRKRKKDFQKECKKFLKK